MDLIAISQAISSPTPRIYSVRKTLRCRGEAVKHLRCKFWRYKSDGNIENELIHGDKSNFLSCLWRKF